jgi:hypothetical protein
MSTAELNILERDVELARERFADDLARLRNPENYTALKNDLLEEARRTKDDLLDKAKRTATDTASQFVEQMKQKAMANPAAALAIGAGVAWRLLHRPPIASLLVGIGAVSLWRTPSQPSHASIYDAHPEYRSLARPLTQLSDAAEAAKDKVHDWAVEVRDVVQEKATSLADQASTALQEATSTARDMTRQAADQVTAAAQKTGSAVRDAMPDEEGRDKLLLGAAILAVTAAVGIAYQRRNEQET